jgi:hypothetical protein
MQHCRRSIPAIAVISDDIADAAETRSSAALLNSLFVGVCVCDDALLLLGEFLAGLLGTYCSFCFSTMTEREGENKNNSCTCLMQPDNTSLH